MSRVPGKTQRSMCAGMLGLEAIMLSLTTPVLLTLTEVSTAVGLTIGLGLTVACVLVAGLVRRPGGLQLGFVIQAAAIALGVLVPLMVLLGVVFLGLYAGSYVLGARIDREKAAAEAEYAAEQARSPQPGLEQPGH